jgi:hypothetical protein
MHQCSNAEQALELQHITAIHEEINTKVCESPSPEKLYEFCTRACASHTHTRARMNARTRLLCHKKELFPTLRDNFKLV